MDRFLPDDDHLRIHAYAWLCSLLFHLAVLGASAEFIRRLALTPVAEPFRWEVALVSLSARATDSIPVDSPSAAEGQPDLLSASNSLSHSPTDEDMPDVTVSEVNRTAQSHLTAESERTQPIVLEEQPAGASPTITQEGKHIPAAAQEALPQQRRERSMEWEENTRSTSEQPALPTSQTNEERPKAVEQETLVNASSSPPIVSAPPSQVREEMTEQAPPETATSAELTQHYGHQSQEPAGAETDSGRAITNQLASLPAHVKDLPSGMPIARPVARDYEWLQSTLFKRLEQLKRQSRPLLDVSGRKKVLLRLVILEGGDLGELKIERSSGEDRLDQEALRLVQLAFPIPLDYALGRPQVIVRIPISYSLSSD
jgi:TonB family protein